MSSEAEIAPGSPYNDISSDSLIHMNAIPVVSHLQFNKIASFVLKEKYFLTLIYFNYFVTNSIE